MEELNLKIAIGANNYQNIATKLQVPKTMQYYYIPTSYKEPLKVHLIDYNVCLSINNIIRIMASISTELGINEIQPEFLFKTKQQASDFYSANKNICVFDWLIKKEE